MVWLSKIENHARTIYETYKVKVIDFNATTKQCVANTLIKKLTRFVYYNNNLPRCTCLSAITVHTSIYIFYISNKIHSKRTWNAYTNRGSSAKTTFFLIIIAAGLRYNMISACCGQR